MEQDIPAPFSNPDINIYISKDIRLVAYGMSMITNLARFHVAISADSPCISTVYECNGAFPTGAPYCLVDGEKRYPLRIKIGSTPDCVVVSYNDRALGYIKQLFVTLTDKQTYVRMVFAQAPAQEIINDLVHLGCEIEICPPQPPVCTDDIMQ